MPRADRRLLDDRVERAIADRVRVRAGRVPGTRIVDLFSRDGFLADRIARKAEDWVVHAAQSPPEPPGNVEDTPLELPDLPFEEGSIALVVAAAIEQPFDVTPELLDEVARVLVPEGRFIVVFRSPSHRAPDAPRSIEGDVAADLEAAGFDPVTETKERHLRDGSELRMVRAVKPS